MHTHHRLFQIVSTIVIITVLFSCFPLAPALAVDSGPMAWLWRQPPYDPGHPYPPRPQVEVVAWGGVDKNVIYAGTYPSSQTGIPHGLYRSNDMGNTWEYLGKVDEDENEYITHLIVHPTKPEILLAGFYGGGIYRSADGGETWTNVLPDFGIHDIEIDPSNPNLMYAATFGINNPYANCSIHKSIDEGQTWQCLSTSSWLSDIIVHPASSNTLFGVYGQGVYRSRDAGATWQKISQAPVQATRILINQNNPAQMFIFGYHYTGIWRTEDGGRSWSNTTSNLPRVISDPTIQTALLDPGDPNTIWVGLKYDGMYVSHDSGDTWEHASIGIYYLGAGIYGPQCTSSDIANGRLVVACTGRLYVQVPRESLAIVGVAIEGQYRGSVFFPVGQSIRFSYNGLNNGPVQMVGDRNFMAAERVIYKVNGVNTSYTEMMALPNNQLATTFWVPWYNNKDLDTQLHFANVGNAIAALHIFIGGVEMGSGFTLMPGQSARHSFAGINNGPVKIVSDQNIVAAEQVLYRVNGVHTSVSEMMALPDTQLDTMYWLPWYNNVDLDTQLRFANVSGVEASVHVYIGGAEMPGSPFTLAAGASTRKSFAGINNGPVKIESDQNIVASERVIYKVNGVNTSFSEMMALPATQLDTTYWLPWYNNVDLDTQLRFGNVSGLTATVHVFIGGVEMAGSPFTLLAGQSTRKSFAGVNNGPVKVVSDVDIVAAERVIYKVNGVNTSFSEMMGLPNSQLDNIYWLPSYNDVDFDAQLRFGVP